MAKESTSQVTGGGRNNYSFDKQYKRRAIRATAADDRHIIYESLAIKERIALVNKRIKLIGGNSKRELTRLTGLLVKDKTPAVKQTVPKQK